MIEIPQPEAGCELVPVHDKRYCIVGYECVQPTEPSLDPEEVEKLQRVVGSLLTLQTHMNLKQLLEFDLGYRQ